MLQVVYGREDIQRWLLESRRLVTSHVSVKFREHFDRHRSIRAPVLTPAGTSHGKTLPIFYFYGLCRIEYASIDLFLIRIIVNFWPFWASTRQTIRKWIPINLHFLFILYALCFLPTFPQRSDSSSPCGQCAYSPIGFVITKGYPGTFTGGWKIVKKFGNLINLIFLQIVGELCPCVQPKSRKKYPTLVPQKTGLRK